MKRFPITDLILTAIAVTALFPCAGLGQQPLAQTKADKEHRAALDRVFDRLVKTSDALERRDIRHELALAKPVTTTIEFLLAQYEMANEDVKNQIEATIGQVDFGEDTPLGFRTASKIQNAELFICVTYALGNSTSRDARKLALQLENENSLLKDERSLNIVRAVVSRVVLDNFQPAVDNFWLIENWNSGRLSAVQETIGIAVALKYPSAVMLPLLNQALRIAHTEEERTAISTSIAQIEHVTQKTPEH